MIVFFFSNIGIIKSYNEEIIKFKENKNMSDKYSEIDIYEAGK